MRKLPSDCWQAVGLLENLQALRMALNLLDENVDVVSKPVEQKDSLAALAAFAKMKAKTQEALSKVSPGTPQGSLLKNRLKALRHGENAVKTACDKAMIAGEVSRRSRRLPRRLEHVPRPQ